MILMIDPPVTPFHPVETIGDWMAEQAQMRDQHRGDPEALACIARAENHAAGMLALAATLPRIPAPDR
jgi:hypothetical protein